MPAESNQREPILKSIFRGAARILIAGVIIGFVLHFVARTAHSNTKETAGFKIGILHGALMPLALPNLLVGDDVAIYATQNTGRFYKLGYTAGVNGCGLLFFGAFFCRINRWRRPNTPQING
jgi:hypothetical protein